MADNFPLVSAIVPAYNHARYVQETLRSLMAQTYPRLELLVIDDGSTDDTWAEINKLKADCEKRFERVVLRTRPNRGACATQNELISLARGQYIYLIASDDTAKPDAIQTLAGFLQSHPEYVLAVGDNEIIGPDSRRIGWDAQRRPVPPEEAVFKTFSEFSRHMHPQPVFDDAVFGTYASLVRGNYIPNGYVLRTAALKDTGGYVREAALEDWYIMLQLAKRGKFKFFNKILFSYRWHGGNTIQNRRRAEQMALDTFCYEQKLLRQEKYKLYRDIFEQAQWQEKVKWRLGDFLKVYKQQSRLKKRYVVEIKGKKFIFNEKPLPGPQPEKDGQ